MIDCTAMYTEIIMKQFKHLFLTHSYVYSMYQNIFFKQSQYIVPFQAVPFHVYMLAFIMKRS